MEYDKLMNQVKDLVDQSDNIVFLGGAGVSTASGIPDFRSATGLYNQVSDTDYSPEYMLSHTFFEENPEEFTRYYKNNLIHKDAQPNQAHQALAKLEEEGKVRAVITQNIDGLHQKSGSRNVIEIHGNLTDYYCVDCKREFSQDYVLATDSLDLCPDCQGIIRPDVVLYEEALDVDKQLRSIQAISLADIFIVAGTSLVVYPVAGYLDFYKGDKLILINKEPTPRDSMADYVFHEDIGRVLSDLAG